MAEDVVIAKFRADLSEVQKQFEAYIKTLEKVDGKEKDTQDELNKTTRSAESVAKRRLVLIRQEEAELKKLEKARKQAFQPKELDDFNKKIKATQDRISTLRGETTGVGSTIKATFAGIGAGLAAAFSVDAILNFSKATVNAFIEAEENANRLKFAITTIGGDA